MLKSFKFIKAAEKFLDYLKDNNRIEKFKIRLSINQSVSVFISSDLIKDIERFQSELSVYSECPESKLLIEESLENSSVFTNFYSIEEAEIDYSHEFIGNQIDYGLRRSLATLFDNCSKNHIDSNVVTFYSYKGGVGRTTSLALTATYLARMGKKVFVIDCDFEAPGLINFFNTAQSESQKPGVIEYLNDIIFDNHTSLDNYVYEVDKNYSGIGKINLMPAGNILGEAEDLMNYIEGIARLDLQSNILVDTLNNLAAKINDTYKPDVILVDSRTGFNNIFGSLANISNTVISFLGDDVQNIPGTEYVTNLLANSNVNQCYVLSILTSGQTKRFNNFNSYISGNTSKEVKTLYLDRQPLLEFVGTPYEDIDDLNDFINGENGSARYQLLFEYVDSLFSLKEDIEYEENTDDLELSEIQEVNIVSATKSLNDGLNAEHTNDNVLTELKRHLPDLYAENIEYTDEYLNNRFFIRPCMEDFFIPEKTLLLGDKGTGKTAIYKALQEESIFELLIEKSQKKHQNYSVLNVTNYENDGFEVLGLDEKYIKNELFIKKFWIFYIWNAIVSRTNFESNLEQLIVNLSETNSIAHIVKIISDEISFQKIEEELELYNSSIRAKDSRLIITFDRLDNIVKPYLWNDIVSPLVKLCNKCPWGNIFPKLFLRRDLYERLGNLTNKSSFKPKIIDLEWQKNEIYSYFLKIVFTYAYDDFSNYLKEKLKGTLVNEIKKKLNKKGARNQLPLDTFLIQPIINAFFGESKPKRNGTISTAYDDLYRNIQSADSTVNLRPFLDLIKYAIEEQEKLDSERNYRKGAVLGLAYCTSRYVRKQAVINYLEDLWGEQGNELVRYFCQDLSNNRVHPKYKKGKLDERLFESLLQDIRQRHLDDSTVSATTINEFKQILIANKIITPYMVGSKTRYGYAYLYTNYFNII
ncbi:tyrosine-protein kinase family protein [Pseudoalteromonas spongiae]|uniref:tyrosine-protein kinase family protein n=1 Tax=Pseudoalteromonas spongiae TaxID=298657 RepID=UPI003736FE22